MSDFGVNSMNVSLRTREKKNIQFHFIYLAHEMPVKVPGISGQHKSV